MADPTSPRPPVRFYRMAAVEDRLDAMAGELDALRRRVAELGHLLEIASAGVELDRSRFADEWPGMSDDEYDALYDDAPEPTKVVTQTEGPRYRVTRLRPIGLPVRESVSVADEVAMVLGTEDRS